MIPSRDTLLLSVIIIGILLLMAMLASAGENEASAYNYLTNSVARITKRAPSQFTFQRTISSAKIELTNAPLVQSNLTLGGTCIVRAKSAAAATGNPMNTSIPMELRVLTEAQAMIWRSNHP